MSDQIAIKLEKVSKNFQLPHEKVDSLKSLFVNPFRQKNNNELQSALRDISFEVEKGEFFGIVGRNGSGKSTLLKIIANIYKPTKGKVTVNGRLVPFIELGVGFNPELTGRENTYLNGALMGFSENEIDRKYDAIVEFAELERFMDQKLKNYSSGMQVRLAFSVATILADSDILLIDEVLAVGDADFQRKCFEYFKKLKRDGKTVIFISHDMSAVREYCDRAVLINDSQLVFSGSSEEVAKEYTKLFLSDIHEQEEESRMRKNARTSDVMKWGSGGVDMTDLKTSKSIYESTDDFVELSYRITASEDFDDSINPGFVIKNEQGDPVCGTNMIITLQGAQKLSLDKTRGEATVVWKIPNVFNAGVYTVDPAVLSASNGETLQWWDEATSFRVVNEKSTPYPVSPKVTLAIK
jgi:ABC-2 type transport system ATP-binding protein